MNGCYRTEREIQLNICNCDQYNPATDKCKSKLETVSRIDGQPICPRNPDAISLSEWEKMNK